jgi:hypothetical protein
MANIKPHIFITFAATAFLCAMSPTVAATSSVRHLTQAAPAPTTTVEGCSASPGSQIPSECSGALSGNQWDKDELECHVPQGYQLKCDHNQEIVGDNTVRCNIDGGPLSSEIEFECSVNGNCQVTCGPDVQGKLPGDVFPTVQRILTAWKPTEDQGIPGSGSILVGRCSVAAAATVFAAAAAMALKKSVPCVTKTSEDVNLLLLIFLSCSFSSAALFAFAASALLSSSFVLCILLITFLDESLLERHAAAGA